jgi:hypothetical protein
MNVRTTSKIAYKEITEEGTRLKQADAIYELVKNVIKNPLYEFKNLSLREIQAHCNYDINAISGRVNELKKNGKLKEDNKRKCSISGRLITPLRPFTIEEAIKIATIGE